MPDEDKQPAPSARSTGRLEKEESSLWRLALLFVVLLATALAAVTWDRLQNLPYHLGSLLPIAVLCVAIAFSAFSYGRRKQVSEMKDLIAEFERARDHAQRRTARPTGPGDHAFATQFQGTY